MVYSYCMISMMLYCFHSGAAAVIVTKFEFNQLMVVIGKYRVKSPAMAAKFDLSSVRRLSCGAAPMDRELELALKSKLITTLLGRNILLDGSRLLKVKDFGVSKLLKVANRIKEDTPSWS